MDILGSKQTGADENDSPPCVRMQDAYVRDGLSKLGGAVDELATESLMVNYHNLSQTALNVMINDGKLVDGLCRQLQKPTDGGYKMADDLCTSSAEAHLDADENGSFGHVSKQVECEQNGVVKEEGTVEDCTNTSKTSYETDIYLSLVNHALDERNFADDLDNPHASPKMKADGHGPCGDADEQEEFEHDRVAKAGRVVDDSADIAKTSYATDLNISLIKHAPAKSNIVGEFDNPHASPKMDVDENGSPAHLSVLRTCKQRGIVNPEEAPDDCTGRSLACDHNNFGRPSSEPTVIEDQSTGDFCNSHANSKVNSDDAVSCEYQSKKDSCEQSKIVNPENVEDNCSRGTHKSGNNNQNICNSVFKSNTLVYPYKRVDDYIFSDKSLVGRFTRMTRPNVPELLQWSHINWLPKLKSILMFKILLQGFFKIEFFCYEDCEFVLENGPWFMGTAGLSLKRWSPDFDPKNPGPFRTPMWMTLPDLPLPFWNESLLTKICSKVGRVLQIAETTTELNCQTSAARVCVEVDLQEGLMASINIQHNGAIWTQDLDYEGIPFRCKICWSTDHLDESCLNTSAKNARKKK